MEESPDCTSSTVTEGANLRLIFPLAACIVLKVKVRTLISDHGATTLHPKTTGAAKTATLQGPGSPGSVLPTLAVAGPDAEHAVGSCRRRSNGCRAARGHIDRAAQVPPCAQ